MVVMYSSDGCLGRENQFYSIGVFWSEFGGQFVGLVLLWGCSLWSVSDEYITTIPDIIVLAAAAFIFYLNYQDS